MQLKMPVRLLSNLELAMNKARQAAITDEILDIVGGAEALNKSQINCALN
jgi:hypothetical protein